MTLADPNVSRRHAEIRQEGTAYWIVDLGSTNGMEVNGQATHACEARARRHDHARLDRGRLRARPSMTLASIAVDEVLLLLKIGFLVLLYVFIWRVVRTASRDLRVPQESFVLAPQRPRPTAAGSTRSPAGPPRRRQEPGAGEGEERPARLRAADVGRRRANDVRARLPTSTPPRSTPASSRGATASGSRTSARRTAPTSTACASRKGRKLSPGDVIRVGETDFRFER